MRKAQGSLEYLIIIAAVLAIAAVVVMFLTGALGGTAKSGNIAQCKVAAASCRTDIDTAGLAGASCLANCKDRCTNQAGADLLTNTVPTYVGTTNTVDGAVVANQATATYQCQQGITPI